MTDRFAGAYDPQQIRIVLLPAFTVVVGVITPTVDPVLTPGILSGYGDDTIITVGRDNVTSTAVAGNDGEHMFQIERKRTGNIGVTLMKSSIDNKKLSRALELTEQGTPVFWPIQVYVLGTQTVHESAGAMVQGYPEDSRGTAEGMFSWVFVTGRLRMALAGRGPGA